MRLTEIKLAGFKTFVDPSVIPIPGNLVGIVGPNGCGKSNVIDAVRWVLGESRASALRGESLQDVIFNGSAKRKPVGRASVELIFDNSAGKAAGQWKTYGEIAIRRVIQRDGESSYYINNIRVRRRDVTDMFLGTGVSGRGYAIIEQGMISRIIEAKPQELRAFLEEASGISRYHEKRHETGLRLTDARSNLQRVSDILQELDKQQSYLEGQAERAIRYQELHKQLTAAQYGLWSQRMRQAAESRQEAQQEIERLEQEMEIIQSSIQETGDKLDELRIQHRVVNDRQHQIQGQLYAADSEIARIEQSVHHIRTNREQFDRQIIEAVSQLQSHEQQLNEANENRASWQDKLKQAESCRISCAEEHTLAAAQLPQIETAEQLEQTQLIELREKLALAKQNEKLQQKQQTYTEKMLQQLMARRERLLEEQQCQPEVNLVQLDELQSEERELAVSLEQNLCLLDEHEVQAKAVQQERDTVQQTIQSLQRTLAQANARQDVLQRLQDQIEDNHALNTWIVKKQLNLLPKLWQQISVEPGWETALEAVLRERIQAVIVDRLEQILDWEAGHEKRPLAKWSVCELLSADQLRNNLNVIKPNRAQKPLNSLLDCHNPVVQAILADWLHGVFVTDSLESGLASRKQLLAGEMLVTVEGHSITTHGVNYFAPDSAVHGILQRQREITQIETECEQIKQLILSQQQILDELEQNYQQIAARIVQIRQIIEEIRARQHERQMQIMQLTQQIERAAQHQAQLEIALADLAVQIEEELLQKHQAKRELAGYEAEKGILEAQVNQAESTYQSSRQILASQRLLVQRLSDKLREAAFSEQNCRDRIIDYEQRIDMITQNRDVLSKNLQELQCNRAELDESSLMADIVRYQAQRSQHEQALIAVRHELEEIDNTLRVAEQDRLQAEQRLHTCSEMISQARLHAQEAGMIEAQFSDKLMELGEISLETTQQFVNALPAKLQARINRLSGEIAGLGPVNLTALQELDALRSRRVHLEAQSRDLCEAIDTLEQAIRQIDRETRERLQGTFDQVNRNLAELFAFVFGGGAAELVLSGDDILDAGVQLNAHPPGKRNSSIQLLSGGEKALTALALVFSLFKLNPAPFCLLDEVDAPLDDSNAGRFCELVKHMADETQFLFISHNKIAMQMAQQLIGVTMREQGVSRVVTVDISKVAAGEVSVGSEELI